MREDPASPANRCYLLFYNNRLQVRNAAWLLAWQSGYLYWHPAGFDFPRCPGAYAPRLYSGLLDFWDWGPKIVCVLTRNTVFFNKRPFGAPSLNYVSDPAYTAHCLLALSKSTLPMLRLLPFKAQGRNKFWKPSKPCHVGIHWKTLAEYSQMSTHVPVMFQSFFMWFYHHFVLAKLAISSIMDNPSSVDSQWKSKCFQGNPYWVWALYCQRIITYKKHFNFIPLHFWGEKYEIIIVCVLAWLFLMLLNNPFVCWELLNPFAPDG